jgi:hypothetical protein
MLVQELLITSSVSITQSVTMDQVMDCRHRNMKSSILRNQKLSRKLGPYHALRQAGATININTV